MANNLFIFKLILAPIIVATATLIARRWGQHVGGIIVGLPLTSAPVSVFFALEQGRPFAAHAAQGAMMGLIPVAVFCAAYVFGSRRLPWYVSPWFGIAWYLAAVWPISLAMPALLVTSLLVPAALTAALFLVGRIDSGTQRVTAPWWDLPLRMLIATTLIVLITEAASTLGPTWSGLLSPFPIFTFVMATFAQRQGGNMAARQLIRGVLTGLFSYTAFFLVVALLIERTSLLIVYPLATLVALSLNSLSLARVAWKKRFVPVSPTGLRL